MPKAQIHQRNHFAGKHIRQRRLEGVDRPDDARHDVIGHQTGGAGRRQEIIHQLPLGAGHQHLLAAQARCRLRRVGGFGRGTLGHQMTVEGVVGQVLLEIVSGVVFQNLAHVLDRDAGQFSVAHEGLVHAHGEDRRLGAGLERLQQRPQMLGQQLRRQTLLVNRCVHQGVTLQHNPVVAATQPDRLGRSGTQIKRQQLIALAATVSIQKPKSHDSSPATGGLAALHLCPTPGSGGRARVSASALDARL